MHRRHPGLRIPRTGLVLDSLIPAILEQKVTGTAGATRRGASCCSGTGRPRRARRRPGCGCRRRRPRLLDVPTWDWHRAGVGIERQRAIRAAATVAPRLEECVDLAPAAALARLRVVPGIGVWTAAETAQRALGDADALSVGDFHIPDLVGHVLIGRRVDDDGMLELLAEWPAHRHRVVRLIELSGVGKPRYGPRFAPIDYRAFIPGRPAGTASASGGQASLAHCSNSVSVSTTSPSRATGSTQRNVPDRPKCPYVAGALPDAGPVRRLRVADLDAEAPVVRRLPAEAGHHPGQPGELHGGQLGDGGRVQQPARVRAARPATAARSPTLDSAPRCGGPTSAVRGQAERLAERLAQVVGARRCR